MKRRHERARQRTRRRLILPLFVAAIICTAGYAFTAGISFTTANAADGTASTAFHVSNMQFHLNSSTPKLIDSVTLSFTTANATTVYAYYGGTMSNQCTGSGSGPWTCTWASAPTVSAAAFRVVAAS
jgi:hypothetical protein